MVVETKGQDYHGDGPHGRVPSHQDLRSCEAL